MKKKFVLAVFISTLFVGASFVLASPAFTARQDQEPRDQEKLAREAKVTKEEAQATALKRTPGTVEEGELEREHGKLVWSFDIRNAKGTIDEVQVSAITGKIVRVEHETKAQEAAEKKKDEKQEKHQN
jgi:hypothetical protein